jgi:hypothetical protein
MSSSWAAAMAAASAAASASAVAEASISATAAAASASAAAAVALLLWLGPEPTSSTAGPAEEWLKKTTATDLVETLEQGAWEPNPEELGELLSDEELDQITLFNASKS